METLEEAMSRHAALALVETMMRAAFDHPRDPRSDAYKLGVRELLNCRTQGIRLVCPYKMGTAEADAFYAGSDEGRAIWQYRDFGAGHGPH